MTDFIQQAIDSIGSNIGSMGGAIGIGVLFFIIIVVIAVEEKKDE